MDKIVSNIIRHSFMTVFPESSVDVSLIADGSYNVKGYLDDHPNEINNGVAKDHPLSLFFNVKFDDSGKSRVKFFECDFLVNPSNKYMAFDTEKVRVWNFKAKNIYVLQKKLLKSFIKTKSKAQRLLKAGKFDVHSDEVRLMIKHKVA